MHFAGQRSLLENLSGGSSGSALHVMATNAPQDAAGAAGLSGESAGAVSEGRGEGGAGDERDAVEVPSELEDVVDLLLRGLRDKARWASCPHAAAPMPRE